MLCKTQQWFQKCLPFLRLALVLNVHWVRLRMPDFHRMMAASSAYVQMAYDKFYTADWSFLKIKFLVESVHTVSYRRQEMKQRLCMSQPFLTCF